MKMPDWLEKERDEFFGENLACDDYPDGYVAGFNACFELMAAERDMLRAALKEYVPTRDGVENIASVALEKSDRFGGKNE